MPLPHTSNMDDKEEDKPLEENVGMEHSDNSEDGDDDDDDDDDDAREEELRTKIRQLTKQLAQNQYYYDGYINLIDAYKELGDLEELRKIRQRMNEVYPLTPELWLSWLKDEQSIATSKEERAHIITLFERAVKDYMSVSLWVEYIMFMLGVGDKDATRAVCESALTAVGTHVGEGLLIWQAVLLTEQQVYSSMTSTSSEEHSEDKIKEQEKQMQKIQSLYKRQVRVPLLNIDGPSLITEMSPWFKGSIERQIKVDLEKALAKLEDKIPYEDELLRCSSDSNKKLSVYNRYLTLVKETDSPSSVINLYERSITDNALDNRLWEDYILFLLKQFSTADYLILPACKRSLRNCPWSGPLVEMYINALQKFDQDGEDTKDVSKKINRVVETSFLSCTPMGTDAVRIWMSYLVYLRRNIDWQAQDQENTEKFRNACFKAIDMIDKTYGEEGDIESEIPRFLARIEAQFANNIEGARTVWNDIILQRNNNYSNSNLWLEYINLERCYGTEKHCRKLFRRALERIWDWVEVIGYAWQRFEQECGTLETYEDYLKRYNDRLAVVMKVREETAAKDEGNKQNNMKMDKRKQQKQYKKNQNKTEEFKVPYPANSKIKVYEKKDGGSPEKSAHSSPPSFISKTVTPNPAYEKKDGSSPERTVTSSPPSFISQTVTPNRGQSEYEIMESRQPMPPPASPGKSAPSPPPGYSGKEPSTPPPPGFPAKEVPPPPGFTDKAAPPPPPPGYPGRTVEPPPGFFNDQSPGRSSKRPAEDDYSGTDNKKRKGDDEEKNSRTVFLKNLSFDVTDEEIHQVFNDCGEIDSLEFVKNFQGRNKGFGYLIFKNIHSAQKALTKDRHPIRGRPVYVNAYEKANREHYFKFKTGVEEKDKLFIKGLPLSMSEEDVKKVFLQHGPIKDIRLVVFRNGHSKGLCYIDYHDEETAAKVKSAMDGAQLEDMTLHVYYSCPPVKGAPKPMQGALGPRDGAMLPRPTTGVSQRGRLNLLPRALLRNTGATSSKNGSDPGSGSSNGSENVEKPKSNEDFRKMLLKN